MENQPAIIKVLTDNEKKILEKSKYNKVQFDKLIDSLEKAERTRIQILKLIKDQGEINVDKIKKELDLSDEIVEINIEYLRELGLLGFLDEHPRFFREIIENSDHPGLFPSTKIIKEKNLCCGCGLCVAICPVNAIDYLEGTFEINEDLCIHCGLCYSACPRSFFPMVVDKIESLDPEVKFNEQFKSYRMLCTAQTTEERIKKVAQDGGIVTTLLKTAFKEGYIDGSFAVTLGDQPLKPLPIFVENQEELLKTAGTKYTNVPLLKIFHDAKDHKKIAVVGTPCIMKALKKISLLPLNKPFFDNIAIKIGVFCMESFDYNKITELLKNEFNVYPSAIKKMDIDKGQFIIYDQESNISKIPIKRIKKYGRFGCFFCDDLTAEYADVSVGSIGSGPGWSTVMVRTKKGEQFCQKALEMNLIRKVEVGEGDKSFQDLKRIAQSKRKKYIEFHRIKMLEQPPNERVKNFEEVPYGLTDEMMEQEVQRCLQCGLPLCVTGCPVNISIPEFIRLLKEGKQISALYKIKESNLLPAICGRVCPQETQCENSCLLGFATGEPVAIGYLERYIADWERRNKLKECPDCAPPTGIKVAIIGSGPAGLACAGELAMRGYDVSIFEAFHAGGGVLSYGIPEFRLPKEIVKNEIETLKMLDVKVNFNAIIGKTLTLDDLKQMDFKAFFIGVGAGLPMFLNISGENLNGVVSANEFLTRSNLMKAYRFPEYDTPIKIGKVVIVVGGGNVALDSARTALRLGAERVIIVYRRSETEMPARREEYHHAKEEGVEFQFLTNPVRFVGDEAGNVKHMEVVKMKLGEPDASGRRRPIPIENSEYTIDTDMIIVAVGTRANPVLTKSLPELNINKWGYIETNEDGQTNIEEVFAGGDIVTGSATVISAMGAGKKAAKAMDEFLRKKYLDDDQK